MGGGRRNDVRRWAIVGGLTTIAWLAAVLPVGCAAPSARSPAPPPALPLAAPPAAPSVPPPAAAPAARPAESAQRRTKAPHLGTTLVATVRQTSPRYAAPGVRAPGQVPATWSGVRSVLPVVATRPGWVKVRLAQRPNGSQAWVPAGAVTLSSTRYRIAINLTTMHLILYAGRRKVFSAPAGIGADTDPTPAGHYFVAFIEPPPRPNPGYGPFVLVTSAHAPNIGDWEGSGDAVVGIHGPLGADSLIGTTGARISHGCIRLHLPALRKLRSVPPGTPIDIIG